jgi:hypothetical protein
MAEMMSYSAPGSNMQRLLGWIDCREMENAIVPQIILTTSMISSYNSHDRWTLPYLRNFVHAS